MGQPTEILNGWRESAKYWAKYSATIRTMFMPLTRALIEQAGIHEGQSVLDVAGGPGEPSLTIAGVVGPRGSVTHTDAVSEMVETARTEAQRRGISNIQFRQCTADSLPFPDNSFDVVVSRLGVMLFADPHASLRQMLRVTKTGGVVGCAVWHKSELNPFSYVITDIVDQHVKPAATDPDAPGAFRFAETGKLSNLMRRAGANDVEENVLHFNMAAPISPQEFWAMRSQTSDTLRIKLEQLPPDEQSKIARQVEQAVAEFFPSNQMKFPAQMIIVTGRK
jgi:ubiquinone/menaquinone biosynthesis C-methylase UbiE